MITLALNALVCALALPACLAAASPFAFLLWAILDAGEA